MEDYEHRRGKPSCSLEVRHKRSVELFPDKVLDKCLIEWESVNERIIRERFYGKQLNTTIIQIYAPKNEADPEDKEESLLRT